MAVRYSQQLGTHGSDSLERIHGCGEFAMTLPCLMARPEVSGECTVHQGQILPALVLFLRNGRECCVSHGGSHKYIAS